MNQFNVLYKAFKGIVGYSAISLAFSVQAAEIQLPLLNKISYQLSEEQWITTSTVKVTVSIDATLDKSNLESISQQMMKNLKKMSDKASWNFVQFDRSQDTSGLEHLHVEAEARLPESELAHLRGRAKTMTRPGETYAIQSLEFTPTVVELEEAHTALREHIYQRAKKEVEKLNQIYPQQRYFVHSIDFMQAMMPMPSGMMMGATAENIGGKMAGVSYRKLGTASMQKSTKVMETGSVVIASEVPSSESVQAAVKK